MRAIQFYAEGIADAVIDGKASIPEVPTGDDEFVELDESGKPKVEDKAAKKAAAAKKRARVTKVRAKGRGRPGAEEGARRAPRRRRAAKKRPTAQSRVRSQSRFERIRSMEITPALVKELRERTGAGMMDCKKALVEAQGRHRSRRRAAA